jgi:hypothetical protein
MCIKMLEYHSQFHAPSKPEAVEFVTSQLIKTYCEYGVTEEDIRTIASKEYDRFGSFGSLAAWMCETSRRFTNTVEHTIRERFGIKN